MACFCPCGTPRPDHYATTRTQPKGTVIESQTDGRGLERGSKGVISPFGIPVLACASLRARRTRLLTRILVCLRGRTIPHVFPDENSITVTGAGDILEFLEPLSPERLM